MVYGDHRLPPFTPNLVLAFKHEHIDPLHYSMKDGPIVGTLQNLQSMKTSYSAVRLSHLSLHPFVRADLLPIASHQIKPLQCYELHSH